ncbi:hypothetical protein HD597_010048 [Nonomuraea thailandensis]|uniref:Uncharacterized protein n=1 Tax=Nonomuraea thailandensis TaxID=1188745 RepID=A0A9X2GZ22_9ACTN|nr:hypothetical protein [Nonomuraea thailandensis]MCP2363028.1 hypothetical protein [Nonomuraea thailandensis]
MTHFTDPPVSDTTPQQEGSSLMTAVGDFNWTRRLNPRMRGLVTTWLEICDDAMRHISIVPASAGGKTT